MRKILEYLFYRYYLIAIKRGLFPRYGATVVLSEIVMIAYFFFILSFSFFLTGEFFLPNTTGGERVIIWLIGPVLSFGGIYLYYGKRRIATLLKRYENSPYNDKYSDKVVLSVRYLVLAIGALILVFLNQFY
ncbi:sodium transporter [Bacteroides fragilis]|jgi:hypothetical protein|nr:sodium transporter [Bacteroides fragilis]